MTGKKGHMIKLIKKLLLITIFTFITTEALSQEDYHNFPFDTTKTYVIELKDNTTLFATFIKKDSISITIKTSSIPTLNIPIKNIKSVTELDPSRMKKGKYWFPNPNPTRYFLGTSAFTLKRGEGYFQNTYLFLNSVNFGLSDHFSLGLGLEVISTFGGGDPLLFVTPKVGYKISENFNLGAGALIARTPDSEGATGIAFAMGTWGNTEKNFTVSLGWGFVEGDLSDKPIISLSGMTRIGQKTALITENWFISGDDITSIFSYGIRFFGKKLSVDLAFMNNEDIIKSAGIGIPYVDFVVKF
jgi:hypothetical protein